jgi:integrase
VSSIETRKRNGKITYRAHYRDPDGKQRSRTFARKIDARSFLTTVDSSLLTGRYVDHREAARPFRDIAEQFHAVHAHNLAADTTRPRVRGVLDNHILPVLGDVPVGAIRPSTVAAAVATWSATLAPGTVGITLRAVRQVLDAAVADGIIASNPAKAVKPPTPPRRRDVHLSDDDVRAIIAATPERYHALVVSLVGLGLRIGEACGLLVTDVDFLRKTVHVRQQRRPGGELGKLKTASSGRDIPADDAVLAALAEQIRRWPRADEVIFSSVTGRALNRSAAGHAFARTAKATGIEVSPHSMRHYFGASLISAGVSVVAVSRWLGHSSPAITYGVYSHLTANDDQIGRAALAQTMRRVVAPVLPGEAPDAVQAPEHRG